LRQPRFFLKDHGFLCHHSRYWVLLDLARDEYRCIRQEKLEALGPWLQGWMGTDAYEPRLAEGPPPPAAFGLAQELLAAGLLSEDLPGTKDAHPTAGTESTQEWTFGPDPPRGSQWVHLPSFLLSCAKASFQLRYCSLESIVASVRARKASAGSKPFDLERARSLVAAFYALRPWYPRSYLCMFDSLALIHFLALYGLFPDWVFAVIAEPFQAHCYVKARNVILNDTLERTAPFVPIMYA
jgi:hypothetical protein